MDTLSTGVDGILQKLQNVIIAPFCHNNKTQAVAPHVNKTFVATCEIADLFNSITLENFTKETSERLTSELLGDMSYYFHNDHLPNDKIGDYIVNIYFAFSDWMIAMKAAFLGIDYTRYADTLCFSTNDEDPSKLRLMLNLAKTELKRLSLTLSSEPKIMGNDTPQMLCDLLVNEQGLENKAELRSSIIIYERLKRNLLVFESMGKAANDEWIAALKKQIAILKKLSTNKNS
ncbi:MAG: hypothetical protein QXD23_03900 [Candidatus Micrarchaeaceae archaeon]